MKGLQRIVVVGTTGSGKTTLAAQLSRRLAIPHIELDALHWNASWTPSWEAYNENILPARMFSQHDHSLLRRRRFVPPLGWEN